MKIFVLLTMILTLSCSGKRDNSATESDTSDTTFSEDRSWVTWDTCSQKPGDHPCNFSFLDQDGAEVELYDYYGKVIVVDLSTMWCGVCKGIAQKGEQMAEDYGSENFVWLTLLKVLRFEE